ncbi:tetratricopeptide repeat protein [candidate division FCPU426 bacterium]|nr:tetratricopeptide repeat protein [candidate division FCPU426 bacterium]
MRRQKTAWLLLAVWIYFLGPVAAAAVEEHEAISTMRREPAVSRQEAETLAEVARLSEESLEQALEYLIPRMKADYSPALDFALGNIYFQMDQGIQAEKAYRQALRKMPAFDRARGNLARLYLQQNQRAEAVQELRSVLLEGSRDPSLLMLTGYAYLLLNQPIPAESAYRQALLINPEDQNAYLGLAKALLEQERFAEGGRILEDVLVRHPDRGELWSLLANARLSMDKTQEAIVALETARRLRVASAEALLTLGDLYLNQGEYQEALALYEKVFDQERPSIPRLMRAIEGFLLSGISRPAQRLLAKARSLEENKLLSRAETIHLRWLEARQAQLSGDLQGALRAYRLLLHENPLEGKTLLALGEIYQRLGETEQAAIFYERAARLPEVKVEALIRHAQLEVEREHYRKAIALLDTAQMIRPRENVARYLQQLRHLER